MNQERYETLVGRVLDDEASSIEVAELEHGLRDQPERAEDFQSHLVLWELWSQECRPERSAEAFVEGWRTRLAAEAQADAFVERTVENLETRRPARFPAWEGLILAIVRARRGWSLAIGSATVIVLFWLWCFGPTVGEPVLAEVQGPALSLERGGQMIPVSKGMRLQPGDVLRVPANGTAAITYTPEKTRFEIYEGTELELGTWRHGKRFALKAGKVDVVAARQRPFRPMVLVTPQAEARVIGTKFTLLTSAQSTRLEVTEGAVRLEQLSDRSSTVVQAGNYAVVESNVLLAPLPLTGSLLREYWTNLPGMFWINLIKYERYPNHPDASICVTNVAAVEMPADLRDNYGQRLRGFVQPPQSGDYTFWIASKDWASLFLSPSQNPDEKVQMAFCDGDSAPHEWDRSPIQQSSTVSLTAGKKYYFEILHKAGIGPNHLALAWQGPNREREVVPMKYVSPFKSN
jgi:ferric-dicitrate binding protein FerR (iron transport regulator)